MADKTYAQTLGRTTRDIQVISTKAGQASKFRVAIKTGYGDQDVKFWDVIVFNEGIQSRLKSELPKGTLVGLEGWLSKDDYNGKESWSLSADRVALLEVFTPTKKGASAPAAAPSPYGADL